MLISPVLFILSAGLRFARAAIGFAWARETTVPLPGSKLSMVANPMRFIDRSPRPAGHKFTKAKPESDFAYRHWPAMPRFSRLQEVD